MWGVDPPRYLRPEVKISLLLILGIGAALVAWAAVRPSAWSSPRRGAPSSAAVLIVWPCLAVATFWLLRVRTFFLGDQMVWLEDLGAHKFPLFSEPLAAMVWHGYVILLDALRVAPTARSLAVLPVVCGVLAGFLAWKISAYLAPRGAARLLAFTLLVTLGTAQLYAGYIESYGILSLPVLLYLLVGLRLARDGGSPVPLGGALALAVATHLVALCLVPSYVVSVLRSRACPLARVALIVVPLAAAAAGWAIGMHATNLAYPFETLRVAVETGLRGSAHATPIAAAMSRPFVGLANVLLLVMPVPLLLLISCLISGARHEPEGDGASPVFLLAAALPGVLGVAVLALPGSPAQDWDLLSIAVLPAGLLALSVGLARLAALPIRATVGLICLALAPLLGFLLVDADEQASVARIKAILDPSTPMSAHERAYGNEKLAKYYIEASQPESLLVYARRAHEAEPASGRYWIRVGAALQGLGRDGEAIPYLEEGLRRATDRYDGDYVLGNCLVRVGRFDEAVAAYRDVLRRTSPRPEYLQNLGVALIRAGKPDSARTVWMDAERRWPDYAPAARSLAVHFGTGAAGSPAPRGHSTPSGP